MANQSIKKGIGIVGSITIDKIIHRDRSLIKLGGVPTYSGITYSRHGIKTYVVSNFADQDEFILDNLNQENVIVFSSKSEHTTRFTINMTGDDRFLELPQCAKPIETRQIITLNDKCAGLHLGPLHPFDIEADAINLLDKSPLTIFLDIQGYTRKIINHRVNLGISKDLAAGLRIARVVKATGTEVKAILDFYKMSLSKLMTKFKIHELVVTLGSKGGFVQKQDGKIFHYDAHKIDLVVDPTGAGDVFFAAYIVNRFSKGKDIPEACKYASQTAAQQVEGKYISADSLGWFKKMR